MKQDFSSIQKQLSEVNPKTKILAVSKLQSVQKIQSLHQQGQRLFAENYVQEALEKQVQLSEFAIEWHLIGNLQKNKVKQVVGRFDLIHSVDSLALAQTIDRKASELGLYQKVLLQLNLAGEETKGGLTETEFFSLLPEFQKLSSLRVCGLMTMPPLFDDLEKARPYFRQLKSILNQTQKTIPTCLELSMGTSSDYLVAAEEGATIVRLGTILFGERP